MTSIRSSSGPGIVSAMFPVAMKKTWRGRARRRGSGRGTSGSARVEHLEQRRRRVAAPVGADLVDLVEHDHRVHRPGVAQRTDEPSGKRADVGPSVAADLGLVPDAAERHADELASGGAGDRLADRRLAGSGRTDQREDRAGALVVLDAALLAQLRDRDVLDDAVLHVLEARRGRRRAPRACTSDRAAPRSACSTESRAASRGSCGSRSPPATGRPCARAARAPARPARARSRASRPRRSSCGTPRRPSPRPRRAPCGSSRAGAGGCTRAAASRRRTRRPPGCAAAPA